MNTMIATRRVTAIALILTLALGCAGEVGPEGSGPTAADDVFGEALPGAPALPNPGASEELSFDGLSDDAAVYADDVAGSELDALSDEELAALVDVDADEEVLTDKASYSTYSIPYNGAVLRGMKSVSTHVCVLTKVQGKFSRREDRARVARIGSYWYLAGSDQTRATARCFAHADFSPRCSSSGTACLAYNGGDFSIGGSEYLNGTVWATRSMLNGFHASILNGLEGPLRRSTNGGLVGQSFQQDTRSGLMAIFAGESAPINAYGLNYAPNALERAVRVTGQVGERRTGQGSRRVSLNMSTGSGMCYLTDVRGRFTSDSDYVHISSYGGIWHLYVAGGTGDVWGAARCMYYRQ